MKGNIGQKDAAFLRRKENKEINLKGIYVKDKIMIKSSKKGIKREEERRVKRSI